ncbi:class I SAM-dependent methyltransferase [Jannaschia seohaensis]|uniref:Methyltransferase domain-containing protein n=1 Tax=Jannaschia seohaensis TaxID=475081 RepID=A0A2Y9C1X9_9RHOB|nr:class I SAM-dependent methyltransferase [Jannaschia seohaensis]PWJ16505.1 methyltransferase family protein [Jannaschia seohaensis]SSA48742.1 Methyltransferase domain-containing protein [Jannaschia seohaensis]
MMANEAQETYWSSPAGLKWIEHERALDAAMAGMLETMLDAADIAKPDRILDIGCGTGASTLAAARRAPDGESFGIDISRPLLERAEIRAREIGVENASFLLADAQTHPFPKGAFDILISRIGMSFFSDSVAAFENLTKALKAGGRMAFVCWAAVSENPWFLIPKKAAEDRLGPLHETEPTSPGPTAFQDIDHVAGLMKKAGLSNIRADRTEVMLTPPDGVRGAARAASRVGPAARIMKVYGGDEADETAIEECVRGEFMPFDRDGDVRVPAVINLFTCST